MVWRFIAEDSSPSAKERTFDFLSDPEYLSIREYPPQTTNFQGIWSFTNNRSYGRLAHGFIFLQDWLGLYEELNASDRHQLAHLGYQLLDKWRGITHDEQSMGFHDETTAQRVIFLSAFLHRFYEELGESGRRLVTAQVEEDSQKLQRDEFYSGTNNHGMFQDIGLLVAADLVLAAEKSSVARSLAFSRLTQYFDACFTEDGIHFENSPSYHLMVSGYLRDLDAYAEKLGYDTFRRRFAPILAKADLYAAFALTPQQKFVPISDTAPVVITQSRAKSVFPGGYLEGAATRGSSGLLPTTKSYVVPKSGYAVHRQDFANAGSSYVFFSAAYNDDYHKHSDDLSLYVANHGREILREAGPYGYDRRDAFTGYGFHSRAHNALLVNDQGLPRTDKKADKLWLSDHGSTEVSLDVEGTCERFSGVTWNRQLKVGENGANDPIHVRDKVASETENKFTIIWHFGASLLLSVRGNAIEIFDESQTKIAELLWNDHTAERIRHVSQQVSPYIQGWEFPTMGKKTPAPVVELDFRGSSLEIEWELRTRDFQIPDRGVRPEKSESQTFYGEKPVHYLLEVPDQQSIDGLIVVFTAILPQKWDSTYNYRRPLQGSQYAKLFILDAFGDQGAYYLSSNRNLAEFRSVQGLIATIISQLKIDREKCVAVGSSKGGTAALIHGAALGLGQIIAAAPQYFLGAFLSAPHPNILAYMTGGKSISDEGWANSIVANLLTSAPKVSNVVLLVGESDHHYRGHVSPLEQHLRSLGFTIRTLTVPGTAHNEIGPVFSDFLRGFSETMDPKHTILHAVAVERESGRFGLVVHAPHTSRIQSVLFRNGTAITSPRPLNKGILNWKLSGPGLYRARIYIDLPGRSERLAFGTRSLRF